MKINFYFNHGLPTLNSKGEVDGGLSQKKKKKKSLEIGLGLVWVGEGKRPTKELFIFPLDKS